MTIADKLTQIAENTPKVFEAGKAEGRTEGYEIGKAEGIEEGKQAEIEAFWGSYLNRENFTRAFCGEGWNQTTFRPISDIKPIGGGAATWMFRDFNTGAGSRMSLTKESIGVEIDLSGATGENGYVFYNAMISELGTIDVSNMSRFPYGLALCRAYTVHKFVVSETVSLGNTFERMTSLEEIRFEGVIAKNGLNFQWSPLSHDSLVSIINALKDYSEDTSGTTWTVTVGSTNYAKLTEEDLANILAKGWNFV